MILLFATAHLSISYLQSHTLNVLYLYRRRRRRHCHRLLITNEYDSSIIFNRLAIQFPLQLLVVSIK